MNKRSIPLLAKSAASGNSFSSELQRKNANSSECIYGDTCPLQSDDPPFNAKTRAALQEVRDIRLGKKKTKTYHSAEEFLADLKS
jgi:hypothetical protein